MIKITKGKAEGVIYATNKAVMVVSEDENLKKVVEDLLQPVHTIEGEYDKEMGLMSVPVTLTRTDGQRYLNAKQSRLMIDLLMMGYEVSDLNQKAEV